MSEALNNKIKIVDEFFNGFSNFIEIENFRAFLLLTLTSQGPMNIMAQLGLGGDKSVINLPYNPDFNVYFQKINLLSSSSIVLYTKSDPITDEFVLEKNDDIFKKFLSSSEIDSAFRGKEKFIFPKVSDCSILEDLKIRVDDMFANLESFISYAQPNILFVFDAAESSKPDLLFTFNMTPQFPKKLDENILQIDVYLDYEHKIKDVNYLKREADYSLTYLKEIKEMSNAELYQSSFSLVLHIKSVNKPF